MNNRTFIAALALAAAALALPAACESPAQFVVKSVSLKPSTANIGETVKVTAQVASVGTGGGRYRAALAVDGVELDTQYLDMDRGAVAEVNFTFSEDQAGEYEVSVGGRTTVLTVRPKLVAREIELKWDSGEPGDYISLVKPATGYLVAFDSPSDNFILKAVRVYGLVYGSAGYHVTGAELQVLDRNRKVIYSTSFSGDGFPLYTRLGENLKIGGALMEFPIPSVTVQGNFFIHIYTGPPTGQGFRMGATDSKAKSHSDVTVRDSNGLDAPALTWPYSLANWFGEKDRVNWMVRVVGDYMVPGQ